MKVNIGITILLKEPKTDSLFSNGIRQNVILLQELYKKCKNVDQSYIINIVDVPPEDYKGTTWEEYSPNIISLEQAKTMCDLVVVCHGNISLGQYAEFDKLGKKMIVQVLGAELNMFNEKILFDASYRGSGIFCRNPYVSAVWTSPHFYNRDRFFFESLYDCPVLEAAYIWDDRFINRHVNLAKHKDPSKDGLYKPAESAKRISTMEPNINMVKTSTTPIVIAELLQRKYPDVLKKMNVFGAEKIKTKKDVIDFVKDMDVYKAKKITFEARYPIVWTLNTHTDIVLCHQAGCELNYLYLDAAWLGYPVVHNSPMMQELGWYYPENNVNIAIEHINYIAKNFDNLEYPDSKYVEKSRKFASKYMISNPENTKSYENLIDMIIKKV